MEAAKFFLGLVSIVAILYLYVKSWQKINALSLNKYDYLAINGWSITFITLSVIGLYTGYIFILNEGGIPALLWGTGPLSSQAANGLVIFIAGAAVGLILFIRIVIKTSFSLAIPAMLVLVIAGHFFFIVLIVSFVYGIVYGIVSSFSETRKKRY